MAGSCAAAPPCVVRSTVLVRRRDASVLRSRAPGPLPRGGRRPGPAARPSGPILTPRAQPRRSRPVGTPVTCVMGQCPRACRTLRPCHPAGGAHGPRPVGGRAGTWHLRGGRSPCPFRGPVHPAGRDRAPAAAAPLRRRTALGPGDRDDPGHPVRAAGGRPLGPLGRIVLQPSQAAAGPARARRLPRLAADEFVLPLRGRLDAGPSRRPPCAQRGRQRPHRGMAGGVQRPIRPAGHPAPDGRLGPLGDVGDGCQGFTKLHPDLPAEQRGTYAGLAHPAVTGYLRELGVTTIELLPIHAAMDEPHLTQLGLTNYWGYSTLSFLAPNPALATAASQRSGAQAVLDEVKTMVRSLHAAGFEVILDVVYNHTAEGGADGPALSLRGLDNLEYYWTDHGSFLDVTGTGGTLDPRSVHVMDLILSSLRYWVDEVHVDGFRFDLAATLGRDDRGFRAGHPLLRAIATDPVLRKVRSEERRAGKDR